MRKFRKSIMVALVVFALFTPLVFSAVTVYAADLTDTVDFITDVKLTDLSGNPFGDDTPKDSELKLEYDYAIPNTSVVNAGDVFTLTIPDEIMVSSPGNFELIDDTSGQKIGDGVIATNGTLTITFTDYAETHSNIHGNFWFNLSFDQDKIGNTNPVTITFDVGASTDPYTIEISFDQPAPLEATVTKSGSFDAATKIVTWTVTVDPEDVEVSHAVVTDTIASGLTFVPDSVEINGSAADPADYTYDAGESLLTYTFPATISAHQVLTFKTIVDDSEFSSEGATVTEHNTATMNYDGGTKVSNDATISTTTNYMQKTGSYDSANKKIDWTIVVNSNYVAIPDAVVHDIIPAGLTLDTDSVYLDTTTQLILTTDFTYDSGAGEFIYAFPASIAEPHTITFSTLVDSSFYEQNQEATYTNSATLSGTNVPGNATDAKGVGVTSTVIDKQGHSYDASTGQILWYVYVNTNKITIQDCTVTDDIPIGQEYVEDSATIDNGADVSGFSYSNVGDATKTGTLTYTFSSDISDTYLITFKTQILDTNVYKSNVTKTYNNTAYIHGTNISDSHDQASRTMTSQVLSKSSTDYDYDTREVTWRITVNSNKVPLLSTVITDEIKPGQEYVEGSATIDNGADALGFTYTAAAVDDTTKTGTLTYTFSGDISDTYHITFKTRVTDLSIFAINGDKIISNSAKISHLELDDPVTVTGDCTVHNTVIGKMGSYTSGNKYIDWTIIINTNTIPLSDAVITDTFQEGLLLDTSSIKLYHMDVDSDGNLTEGAEITLGVDNVKYDIATRTLNFTIPAPVAGAYKLILRTDVTDKSKSPFTNTASFAGTGTEQTDTSSSIAVSWAGSGSSGTGDKGSIRVYKVDSTNDTKTLPGAVFDLIDRFGNVVQEGTTGDDGYVLFDWIKFDVNYTVKEVTPPTGYLLSDEEYAFQISGSEAVHDIEYRYADEVIKGAIRFTKYDTNMNPLPGTEFTLFNAADTDYSDPVMTATSGDDGVVLFENVPYGSYAICETTPAQWFYGSDTVLTASVTEDGSTVTTNPEYIQNEKYKGSVKILKVSKEGNNPLSGAVMGLYLTSDMNFSNPVVQATSGNDGVAQFDDIPYGDYVAREISPPTGYTLSTQALAVSVIQDEIEYSYTNEVIKGAIRFTKYDTNMNPVPGTEFTLYNAADTDYSDPVMTATSGDDGVVLFENVPYGSYAIRETTPAQWFYGSDTVLTASVTVDGSTVTTNPEYIQNEKYKGSVKILKVSKEGNTPLSGAVMGLYAADDIDFSTPVVQATSGNDGVAQFDDIPYGDYVVREISPPTGYALSTQELAVSVVQDEIEYRYTNDVIKGAIRLTKYDTNMNPVPGTEFTLYNAADTDYSDPLMTATSGDDGVVLFENVPYGSYAIRETTPALGFYGSDVVLMATVTEYGTTVDASPSYVQNQQFIGSVMIIKTAEDGTTPIAGAVMGLYAADDIDFSDPVAQATSGNDGAVIFANIPYGDYMIREISAPSEYVLSTETVAVSVTDDGVTVDAGVYKNAKGSPKTGDGIGLYALIFIISAVGLLAFGVFAIRRKARHR